MTPDNGQVQIQFSGEREGAAGDTERGNAKQKTERARERVGGGGGIGGGGGERSRRERFRSVRAKDEAGREME